jgi:hypothetical protein
MAATSACTGTDVPAAGRAVRDSAGITIVDNHAPPAHWTLSSSPITKVGTVGNDSTQVLWGVVDAVLLQDRTLVVANGGTQQLRFYTEAGDHLRDAGRRGNGPGEFQSLARLWRLSGDTIAVFDRVQRRVTWFGPDAAYGGEVTLALPSPYRRLRVLWPSRRRGFLARAEVREPPVPPGADIQFRDSVAILAFDSAGGFLREVLRHPDELLDVGLRDVGAGHVRVPFPVHFSPQALATADSNGIWISDATRYEIAQYNLNGRLSLLMRRALEPVAVRPEDVVELLQHARRRLEGRAPAEIRREMGLLEGSPAASAFPVFDRVHLDAHENLWVGPVRGAAHFGNRWDVFDTTGRLIADVVLPVALTPTDMGVDYVVGYWKDMLDVEYVSVYGLRK